MACTGLADLVAEHGPPASLAACEGSTFASLARSIVAQQLAIGAARTIHGRFLVSCKVILPAHNQHTSLKRAASVQTAAAPYLVLWFRCTTSRCTSA